MMQIFDFSNIIFLFFRGLEYEEELVWSSQTNGNQIPLTFQHFEPEMNQSLDACMTAL